MQPMNLNRAQELIRKKNIDVLLASGEENFYYASGYRLGIAQWLPRMAVVPAEETSAPAIIVSSFVEGQTRQQSYIDDIRSYPVWMPIVGLDELIRGTAKGPKKRPVQFSPEHAFGMLADVLKEKGLHDGVIAIETNLSKDPEIYSILSQQNPKAKFVEADDIFWELRKIKTDDEINALRVAADLAVKGLQSVVEDGVLGTTIGELHLRYKRGILQNATAENAMDLGNMRINISSGDHFFSTENPQYVVSKGDVIWVDNGLQVFGYTSDMGRTFSVGKPGDMQKRLFEALREGFEKATSMVKPGVKMREIHRILQETVNNRGYDWYARGHMGHSVGIGSIEQPPFVTANEETVLEPNMIICVECGAYVIGQFGAFQIEDMFLVTPEGHEVLTNLPRDMVEL